MSKPFWAIIAVIIVIFGGILFFKNDEAHAPDSNGAQATNHVKGEGTAGVTLVEYGDFECTFCGQYYPIIQEVRAQYGDKIKFQFRNLPLIEVHRNAYAAARVAEAAGIQGKYWEMYDLLFQNQPSWEGSSKAQTYFDDYARQLNLDMEKFKTDTASNAVNDAINADVNAFNQLKITKSTPTFLLNGKKITPRQDFSDFSKLIDAEIAAKAKTNKE
jgi:protein-disulfide isomerase